MLPLLGSVVSLTIVFASDRSADYPTTGLSMLVKIQNLAESLKSSESTRVEGPYIRN